jgi:hypothetical protein
MPQIKFGTVVTDMKGKANGSVFSSNRQGAYMRTNKSGGGKKSQSWENSKSRLAFLSTQWKALTLEQREQWNAIAPSYPALNKFNEPYNPSGYQVFMRLNGTLYAQGLPLLTVPNPPRSTPDVIEIPVYCPDNFCFTPNKTAYLGNVQEYMLNHRANESDVMREPAAKDVFATLALGALDLFEDSDAMKNSSYAVRFVPKSNDNHVFSYGQILPLLLIGSSQDQNIQAYIAVLDSKFSYLCLSNFFLDSSSNKFLEFSFVKITNEFISKGFHFGLQYNVTADNCFKLFLNGVKYELDGNQFFENPSINPAWVFTDKPTPVSKPSGMVPFDDTAVLSIGFPDMRGVNLFNASDFRFISTQNQINTECENHEDCGGFAQCYMGICVDGPDLNVPCEDWQFNMMSYGYVLGYENVIVPLNIYSQGRFPSVTGVGRSFSLQYLLSVDEIVSKKIENIVFLDSYILCNNLHTYVPLMYVQNVEVVESGWLIQVLCSGMLSAGRIETQVPYKQLICVQTNSNSTLISNALRLNYGGFSPNSNFYLKFNFMDSTTGATQNVSISSVINPAGKRKGTVRFKAGSDLSSSVN